ncbi:MAG: VWA domain-containing protein [Planctomycetaceae bacterium]
MQRLTVFAVLAAAFAVLTSAAATAEDKAPARTSSKIQLAILLDTSGSMDGLINQTRTQLWRIVNELATAKRDGKTPNLEVALYEYGKASIPKSEGYLRQILALTDDLDDISEKLFALKTNGGSEHCGQVIQAATEGLKWSPSDRDLKLIFIAGNEPFTQGSVDYKNACAAAVKKGITVNTIYCGPKSQGVRTGWRDGALRADGSFTSINQNRQVAVIRTPFDARLAKLSGNINKTYVAYGRSDERKRRLNRQVAQDKAAKNAAPAAAAARAAFKGKAAYKTSAWDLIDALKKGKLKLKDVKTQHLPKEMQKMSLAEKKAYIAKKTAEREKIRAEIKKLSKRRQTFITEARKKSAASKTDALDDAIIKTIRTQASKKKFRFEKK